MSGAVGPSARQPARSELETAPEPAPDPARSPAGGPTRPFVGRLQALGLVLFLFIPLVLFLFVVHPAPIAVSLTVGVALMLAHRFVARPYMLRALEAKCLWCNRALPGDAADLALVTGGGILTAHACPGHREPLGRFFRAAWRLRGPLRVGIFLPLLVLLGTLAAAAAGRVGSTALGGVTDAFRLAIGLTVNVLALGYGLAPATEPARVPFPAHNFSLLGVRNLLWILRLVGLWWIALGATGLYRLLFG